MKQFNINNKIINSNSPAYVIAEIGNNHQGDLELCMKMIEEAQKCQASAIKLQKRDNKKIYTKSFYDQKYNSQNAFGTTYGEHREYLEFNFEQYEKIRNYCNKLNIDFICTAFDPDSANFLNEIKIDAFKVASADIVNTPLLEVMSKYELPIIISTGGALIEDINRAKIAINKTHNNLSILHCVATYPSHASELNLNSIEYLNDQFLDNIIGFSSHFNGISLDLVAYILGAKIIEKHFTLDRTSKGSDNSFSLEPQGLSKLVRDLRRADESLGKKQKLVLDKEVKDLLKMRKKIVAAENIKAGTILNEEHITYKSPGDGIPPYENNKLLGRKLKHDIFKDEGLKLEDVE